MLNPKHTQDQTEYKNLISWTSKRCPSSNRLLPLTLSQSSHLLSYSLSYTFCTLSKDQRSIGYLAFEIGHDDPTSIWRCLYSSRYNRHCRPCKKTAPVEVDKSGKHPSSVRVHSISMRCHHKLHSSQNIL